MALGGLVFFKEKVRLQQWACFAVLAVGMLTFFHPVLEGKAVGDPNTILTGFLIVMMSAMAWCLYALLQKALFSKLSPTNILLGIYVYAMLVMLPFSQPSELLSMNQFEFWVAAFCCLNTLVAYGSLAKAMGYWQTVQVSAAIALTPVIAFIITEACVQIGLWQGVIQSAHADALSLFGMALVVGAGANCVYPIVGSQEYGWQFVGTDVNPIAISAAQAVVTANPCLKKRIVLRQQIDAQKVFDGIWQTEDLFDVTLCNPPFHSSESAMASNETMRRLFAPACITPKIHLRGLQKAPRNKSTDLLSLRHFYGFHLYRTS